MQSTAPLARPGREAPLGLRHTYHLQRKPPRARGAYLFPPGVDAALTAFIGRPCRARAAPEGELALLRLRSYEALGEMGPVSYKVQDTVPYCVVRT